MSVWASGPDVAELACLRGAGFWPVGRVTGCAVLNFAWWRTNGFGVPTQLSVPYPQEYKLALPSRTRAYARLLYQGRRAAAKRMAAQCTALGGDGVVGVEVGVTPYPGDKRARQFTATGTAVRAAGSLRSASPFLAGLTAQDFAKLVHAGWVPADLAIGTACTWESWSSGTAPRRWDDGNRELERWTEAVAMAREQARDMLQADAARSGADGVVLGSTDTHATVRNMGPWRSAGGYCVAEATLIGTAIAQFRPPSNSQKLPATVMGLRASTATTDIYAASPRDIGTAIFPLFGHLNRRSPRIPRPRITADRALISGLGLLVRPDGIASEQALIDLPRLRRLRPLSVALREPGGLPITEYMTPRLEGLVSYTPEQAAGWIATGGSLMHQASPRPEQR